MKGKIVNLFLILLIASAVASAAIGNILYQVSYFTSLPEYEIPADIEKAGYCPLCLQIETNPPCLINLNAGTVSEIRLYEPHRTVDNELSEKSYNGVIMSGGAGAGAHYYSFPDEHYTDLSVQKEKIYEYSQTAAEYFFCVDCMELINAVRPNSCFLLADCYDKDNIRLYKMESAEDGIDIRQYNITIEDKGEKYLRLKMISRPKT